jgi:ribosome-binding factor A
MDHKRSDRLGELLLEFVSELLTKEISDPRIRPVTLTRAEVSKDLKHARIYFSLLRGDEGKPEVLAGLKSASGFIRAKIGKELKLRFVPSLDFIHDDTQSDVQRIDKLLQQIKKDR